MARPTPAAFHEVAPGIPGLPPGVCADLLREALDCCATATRQERAASEDAVRGGSPARRLFTHPGGPRQTSVYSDPALLKALTHRWGRPVVQTGSLGSYSYYVTAGDHLALHRDIDGCDLAVITCLCDMGEADGGGRLLLYPGRWRETLSSIRSTSDAGVVPITLRPGYSLVVFGGLVPHAITPVLTGQRRIVSLLCFRLT